MYIANVALEIIRLVHVCVVLFDLKQDQCNDLNFEIFQWMNYFKPLIFSDAWVYRLTLILWYIEWFYQDVYSVYEY